MKENFGLVDGQEVHLYTIENDAVSVSVTEYGARLVRFIEKSTGIDAVKGFDNIDGYLHQTSYIGASIGRTANRIAEGRFVLNGKTYQLAVNNGPNDNHGGIKGFNARIFAAEEKEDRVIFHYLSPDGEEGFPGTLHVTIAYRLLKDGLEIQAAGRADADTLFAYTNHAYFNLDGSDDATHHKVMIHSDRYALSDENGLALNTFRNVEGTPFDFRTFHEPAERINADDEQLKFGHGYDHYYPVAGTGMREFAVCEGKQLKLITESDQPGMHFYSANWLEGETGKHGEVHVPRSALCFECAYMPNAVNYTGVPQPIVKAGETSVQTIRWHLVKTD